MNEGHRLFHRLKPRVRKAFSSIEENRVYWSWVFKIVNIDIIIYKYIFQCLKNKMISWAYTLESFTFVGVIRCGLFFIWFWFFVVAILLGWLYFVDASTLSSERKLTLTRFVFRRGCTVFSWKLSTNTTTTESLRILMIPQFLYRNCFVPIGKDRKSYLQGVSTK